MTRRFLLLLFVAGPLAAGPITNAAPTTTFTTSVAEVDTISTTQVTQQVDTWSVDLRARMLGGSFLFDKTYTVPFSDPLVQAGLLQAEGLLAGAGASSFQGPALLNSSTSLLSSVSNTVTTSRQTTQQYIGVKQFIGSLTIYIGELGICQSYTLDPPDIGGIYATPTGCSGFTPSNQFSIAAGTEDFDAMTLSLVTISQTNTTTNTYLTSQLYEIDGLTSPAAVPEPGTAALLLALGAGLLACRRARGALRVRSRRGDQ